MSTTKLYCVYCDHAKADGQQRELWYDTFEQARETADILMAQGSVLVHIREQVTEVASPHVETKPERLVWAAASPDLDWR